ncbi:hypothetical protein GGI07_000607 [Coemansia sp. Benny D115]|nr:hypothetical protein GGI07_000607 [Coemansia sp. Benny D115]
MRRGTASNAASKTTKTPCTFTETRPAGPLKRSMPTHQPPSACPPSRRSTILEEISLLSTNSIPDAAQKSALGKRSRLLKDDAPKRVSPLASRRSNLVITSSDSSEEVECIEPISNWTGTFGNRGSMSNRKLAPIIIDGLDSNGSDNNKEDDDDDDDFVAVNPRRRTSAISSKRGFQNAHNHVLTRANSTSNDIQVVDISDNAAFSKAIVTPPKKTSYSNSLLDTFMPSSPPLLRANSPTIRRYNSQASQPVVLLAKATQVDPAADSDAQQLALHPGGRMGIMLDVGGSTRHASPEATRLPYEGACVIDEAVGVSEYIPETPRASPKENVRSLSIQLAPESSPPLPPHLLPAARKDNAPTGIMRGSFITARQHLSTELSSDPISEFGTPINSPSVARASAMRLRPVNRPAVPRMDLIWSSEGDGNAQLAYKDNETSQEEGPGITQWYHDEMRMFDSGDSEEYSQAEPFDFGDLSQFQGDDHGDSQDIESEDEDDDELILVEDNHGKRFDNAIEATTEDGYSSPLEGFWDLRKATEEDAMDREMYVNQFAPSGRQQANRERTRAQREAVQNALNNGGSDSGVPSVSAGRATRVARGRRRAAAGGTSAGSSSTRGRTRRTARGGRRTKKRRRGSSIRPATSTRAAASRQTAAAPIRGVPVAYNHYASEPILDISTSMNWEGGGMSRFG